MIEPISPELALVDPELRRAAIASLDPQQFRFASAHARPIRTRTAPPAVSARSWPRHVVQSVLLLGLLAAGVVVANVAARNLSEQPVLLTSSTGTPSSVQPIAPHPKGGAATGAKAFHPDSLSVAVPAPAQTLATGARGAVERKLLLMIFEFPRRWLPRSLIDQVTGRPVEGIQAACRPATPSGFLCLVRPQLHKPNEGMYVRYRSGGFTRYPYRSG